MRFPLLRLALAGLLAIGGCALTPAVPKPGDNLPALTATPGVGTSASTGPQPGSAQPSPTTRAAASCQLAASRLSLAEQVGQLLMVGVAGRLDAAERRAISKYKVGSVVLLGDQGGGTRATASLTAAIAQINPAAAILVAADQEGGLVQRLSGPGFTRIPSAAQQSRMDAVELRQAAARWGSQLARAGVLLNLAPVADVVPAAKAKTNKPIGELRRGFGADPAKVTASTSAVIAGLGESGVAATAKHFPGLGEVVGNTDHAAGVVDRVTTAASPSLAPFRAAVASGVDAVMVSSATYRRIDPDRQAVFSPKVLGLLRDWGYDQVVISDDLGAAASVSRLKPESRAVDFVAAGGDLVINADPRLTAAMAKGLTDRARREESFAARVVESTARVLALKSRVGLVDCG